MIIRQERPEDYDTVYHVVKEAFENAEYTDGNEQNFIDGLFQSNDQPVWDKKIREDLRRYLEKKGKLKSRKTLKYQAFGKKYKT